MYQPQTRLPGRKIARTVFSILLILIFLLQGQSAPARADSGGLFIASQAADLSAQSADPTIIRSRSVEIQTGMLPDPNKDAASQSSAGSTLTLNLFDDATFTAVQDRLEVSSTGYTSWIGTLQGVEYSQVILTVGPGGIVSGNITLPGAFYQVRPAVNGVHAIRQIDQSKFPQEKGIALPEPPAAQVTGQTDPLAPDPADAALAFSDTGAFIDVMVVYTAAAKTAAGGDAAMTLLINLAVTETNTGYENSNITQRIRLVHSVEVDYEESLSDPFENALYEITNPSDGIIDEVNLLRNTYHADLVSFWIYDPAQTYCGLGWMMQKVSSTFESNAFSVVDYTCAAGYYSFGHEMGHNEGAGHDWYVDGSKNQPYTYNKGYVNTIDPNPWRTIMAYNNRCSDLGLYCTRLNYWSNPKILYDGYPMGVGVGKPSQADNHTVLNKTATTVANFRQSGIPGSPTPISPTGKVYATRPVYSWTAAPGATKYKLEVYQGTTKVINTSYSAAVACIDTACSAAPAKTLSFKPYRWLVSGFILGKWVPSFDLFFNIPAPGFDSQFITNSTGWSSVYGGWSRVAVDLDHNPGGFFRNSGVKKYLTSTAYKYDYTDMDFQVRMKRYGCLYCDNSISIRGTPKPLDKNKYWAESYDFTFANDGTFSVWKNDNGDYYPMQYYTSTAAIIPDDWNILRVTTDGASMSFYINGTLVWSGTDSSYPSGKVGIGMYRDTYSSGNYLYIDWATLDPASPDIAPGLPEPVAPHGPEFPDRMRNDPPAQ
jgi:hypothetical protein